jgi:hypothetical protein
MPFAGHRCGRRKSFTPPQEGISRVLNSKVDPAVARLAHHESLEVIGEGIKLASRGQRQSKHCARDKFRVHGAIVAFGDYTARRLFRCGVFS